MKTPDEIKKGLQHCKGANPCADCAYDRRDFPQCIIRLQSDALSLIRRLESSYSQVSKALCDKENATLDEVLQAVSQLKAELAAVKRERDASVRGLHGDCETCKHYETENCAYCVHDPDAWCAHEDNWEWEGICPENTEVQDGQSDA